eukprot:2400963-Pleurochrysis_carterae.AAC.1
MAEGAGDGCDNVEGGASEDATEAVASAQVGSARVGCVQAADSDGGELPTSLADGSTPVRGVDEKEQGARAA